MITTIELDLREIRDNGYAVQMNASQARAFVEGSLHDTDDIDTAMDNAQADANGGKTAYVIIKVVG